MLKPMPNRLPCILGRVEVAAERQIGVHTLGLGSLLHGLAEEKRITKKLSASDQCNHLYQVRVRTGRTRSLRVEIHLGLAFQTITTDLTAPTSVSLALGFKLQCGVSGPTDLVVA